MWWEVGGGGGQSQEYILFCELVCLSFSGIILILLISDGMEFIFVEFGKAVLYF